MVVVVCWLCNWLGLLSDITHAAQAWETPGACGVRAGASTWVTEPNRSPPGVSDVCAQTPALEADLVREPPGVPSGQLCIVLPISLDGPAMLGKGNTIALVATLSFMGQSSLISIVL